MSTLSPVRRAWSAEQRLQHFIQRDPLSGCWIWQGAPDQDGYGRIKMHRVKQVAHRFAWSLRHGAIPPGAIVCHRCDERACVNPDHLFLGTHALNGADRKAKMKAVAAPPAPPAAEVDRAQIRIVYRGLEMVGEVAIRPLLGLGGPSELA